MAWNHRIIILIQNIPHRAHGPRIPDRTSYLCVRHRLPSRNSSHDGIYAFLKWRHVYIVSPPLFHFTLIMRRAREYAGFAFNHGPWGTLKHSRREGNLGSTPSRKIAADRERGRLRGTCMWHWRSRPSHQTRCGRTAPPAWAEPQWRVPTARVDRKSVV